jgi:hypothetical protein
MEPQHHRFYMQAAAQQQLLSTPIGAAAASATSSSTTTTASSTSSSPAAVHLQHEINATNSGDAFNPVAAAVCHLASLANSFSTNTCPQISPIGSSGQSGFQAQQNSNSFYSNQLGLK